MPTRLPLRKILKDTLEAEQSSPGLEARGTGRNKEQRKQWAWEAI